MDQTLSGFSMRRAAVLSMHSMTIMMSYFLCFSVWYRPNSIWLQHEKSSSIINALCDHNDVIFPLFQCVVLSVPSMSLMMSYFLYFSVSYGPNFIWLQHEKSSGIISALYGIYDVNFPYFSMWYVPNSIWLQHEKSSGINSAFNDLNDVISPISVCGMDQTLSSFSMRRVPSITLMMLYFLCFRVWYGLYSILLQHEKSSGMISAFYGLNDVTFPLFQCMVWTKLYLASA